MSHVTPAELRELSRKIDTLYPDEARDLIWKADEYLVSAATQLEQAQARIAALEDALRTARYWTVSDFNAGDPMAVARFKVIDAALAPAEPRDGEGAV